MARRKKEKKNTSSKTKPIGFGVILLIIIVAIVSSFHPNIESIPTTPTQESIKWPQDAPQIELIVKNMTNQRIETRYNDQTIAHIKPHWQTTIPIFDKSSSADQEGDEWEISELYKFNAPGNRHITLSPSLFVLNNTLLLSHPHYITLRGASISGGQKVEPGKKYRLIFTIQGNKFEDSTTDLEIIN